MARQKATDASSRQKTMFPLVSKVELHSDLSDSQFVELETAGGISLPRESRTQLNNIAALWIAHDTALQSPRPGEFRGCLETIIASLETANAGADLNREGAATFERHMFHWLFMGDIPGGSDALVNLGYLPGLIEFFKMAEKSLPPDKGSTRPMDDYRFIHYLADQFEACGGNARIYFDKAGDTYADTPFHRFVRKFYGFLPLKSRRTSLGLGESIRLALRERRKRPKGG